MRRELLTGYVRFEGDAGDVSHPDVRMDGVISNLLCSDCNSGWANDLEAAAGENLFDFLHQDGTLSVELFLRWLAFFQFKAHMYYARSESLRSAPLGDIFSKLRDPNATVSLSVFAGRIDADPTTWQFGFHVALLGAEVAAGFMLVTHAVLWFMPFEDVHLPIPLVKVRDGLSLSDLPVFPPGSLTGTIAPIRSVDVLGEHVQHDDQV